MIRAAIEAQAPPKQSLEVAINTLSSRLASATLLEDRRGAILGLRSFADEYPATVASKALRELITTLGRDVADIDTGKVVLETLLKILNPKPESLEASDQVALWVADQFTQRQENIALLLALLENDDFYSRLYSLQLLQAISASRPERTQDSILAVPLGIARLVGILDDRREAVQGAGVLLLNELAEGSVELQKVVAFESAFERLFAIIQRDGSLAAGRELAEDSMNLLAKLLDLNASNQSLFRETNCIRILAQLLARDARERKTDPEQAVETQPTREKNIWGLLTLLRMFLVEGNPGCRANQTAFEKQGLLQLVLDLSSSQDMAPPLRAEALRTCADIIKGNAQIQERFAHNQVSSRRPNAEGANGHKHLNGESKTYVIDALLDIALSTPSVAMFDMRYAACECIQAYYYGHTPIRRHFLQRAIEGYTSGEDETSNILTILIQGSQNPGDPYRTWFAAVLCHHLIYEDPESKNMVQAISEGDADKGEDVVSSIQAMTGNLVEALQAGEDDRTTVAFFMVLCVWLFDDADAVDNLLSEGSTVQSLIQAASRDGRTLRLPQGLSAVLLGIVYEFSTKDSPIPRRKLQPLLLSGLGREHYVSKIKRLREDPLIRDFEVLPQGLASAEEPGALPEVYFDQLFVDFLKDNFSRLIRAIDRDPGIEVARVAEGIDRDLVDTLRGQLKDKSDSLDKLQAEMMDVQGKLGQEQADSRRSKDTFDSELARIKNINEALQRGHEDEVDRLRADHDTVQRSMTESHQRHVENMDGRMSVARNEAEQRVAALEAQHQQKSQQLEKRLRQEQRDQQRDLENQHNTSKHALQKQIQELEQQNTKSTETVDKLRQLNEMLTKRVKEREEQIESKNQDKQLLEEDIEAHMVRFRGLESRVKELKGQIKDLENRVQGSEKEQTAIQVQLNAKEEARSAAQTELDDLLMVLGDLEEKRKQDKKKIKDLGGTTSDDEDEDEDDEAEESEEGEEDGEQDGEEEEGGADDELDGTKDEKDSGADAKANGHAQKANPKR